MVLDKRGGYNRKDVNENFFKTWTPSMAYVLGFIYADGSLLDTNKSSRTYYLSFSNNEYYLLTQIRKALESTHNIVLRPSRSIVIKNKVYIARPSYLLRIGNKVIYQDLINLGMQHQKSNIMELPEFPSIFFAYFLRGYFDGDGCVSYYSKKNSKYPYLRVLFTSGSYKFLDGLEQLIRGNLGIQNTHLYKRSDGYNLVIQGTGAILVLNYIYASLEEAPYLDRKYYKYVGYKNNMMGPRIKKDLAKRLVVN